MCTRKRPVQDMISILSEDLPTLVSDILSFLLLYVNLLCFWMKCVFMSFNIYQGFKLVVLGAHFLAPFPPTCYGHFLHFNISTGLIIK